ncbi:hypothetical protein FRC18_007258 [Serendipita sp. 400]|nr:hypothetical protein FRC18_007258 [Serendipita sp. 400]
MSLPSLINGADCGPSNALQSLTKRIDADRGIQSDFFGSGHAGPSTSSFRTVIQGNSQLSGEKSQFFNATRRPGLQGHGPAAFNFREMNQALPKHNHALPQAQGASLLPEFQESLNKQAGIDGWAAEFLKAGPPGPLQSLPSTRHEVALNQPLHPPGTMDHLMRPAFTNNPYVFDHRHASSDWRDAEGMDLSVLEREAAVLKDPSNAMAWFNLGVKQQANEREAKAIQALRKALELDPSMLPAWMELAVSYTNDGSRNEAYNAISEWINHNPKYNEAVARWKAGRDLSSPLSVGELIDCLVTMARSTADDDLDADVQIALGVLFNTTEEYEKAQDCFLAALDVRPDDYMLYNRVGATIANHGRPQDAIEYYHRALALNPSYIRARFNLGISCMSLHRNEDAAGHILDALVLQENDAMQSDSRGITSSTLWETLRSA